VQLLVEIKDIREELGILKRVINDQLGPLSDFITELRRRTRIPFGEIDINNKVDLSIRIDVIENHLHRIDNMIELSDQTNISVSIQDRSREEKANIFSSTT